MKNYLQDLKQELILNNQLLSLNLSSRIITNSNIKDEDKQILLLLLQDRDRNYIRINHNIQIFERIKAYLALLRPLALPLEKLIRIGGENDGGYVMYNGGGVLSVRNKTHKAFALSLGVSEYAPWDLAMAKRGFRVLEYDASIDKSPYNHKNIIFHKKFIANKKSKNTIILEQIFKDYKFDEKAENILQCDIENSEWEMLESIDIALLAKYFTQMIFEFHGLNPEESQGFKQRIKELQRLNEYFIPIHTHFNNHGKIFYSQGLFFSSTIELSFLRKDLAYKYLSYGYRFEAGNLAKLDYVNSLSNPELPIRFEK